MDQMPRAFEDSMGAAGEFRYRTLHICRIQGPAKLNLTGQQVNRTANLR